MTPSGLCGATDYPPGLRLMIVENRPGLPNIASCTHFLESLIDEQNQVIHQKSRILGKDH